jgi:hypothetical protein
MKRLGLFIMVISFFTLYAGSDRPRILIDFDPETPGIDSVATAATGQLIVGIVCQKVVNLDSYTFDISFDPGTLDFQSAVEDNPLGGLTNILKKHGGETLPVRLGLKNGCDDTVSINNTLAGSDSADAPEGEGLLGIILFKVLKTDPCTLTVHNAMLIDYEGAIDSLPEMSGGRIIPPASVLRTAARPAAKNAYGIMTGRSVIGGIPCTGHPSAMFDIRGRSVSSVKKTAALPFGTYVYKKRNYLPAD